MSWRRKRGRAVWLLAVPAAVVGLAACGGGSDEAAPSRVVQDFRAIQVGEPKVEILRAGTAAVIRVTTDPPTVCAAAYGESEALGRVANDPGMGGSAITDHSVTLRSLAPNTTYFFRLTATDAAGGVYQTRELLTFTTEPPPRDPAASGRNVALGATVLDVSSSFSEAFAASNALDGDLTTEWSSAGDGNDASLTVDLGRKVEVAGVAFRTREMADGSAITRSFSLVVDDGTRLGPFTAGDRQEANVAAVSFTGRILRFEVEASTGGNTGASEIEVYRREG